MKYFKPKEFACRCGCGLLPNLKIMELADRVREEWGSPIIITSGARCEKRTQALRDSGFDARLGSAHNQGLAIDICPQAPAEIEAFQAFCVTNVESWGGWMENPDYTGSWVHLQLRPASRRVFDPGVG